VDTLAIQTVSRLQLWLIPVIVNLLQWCGNYLRSNNLVTRCSFSITKNTFGSLFLLSTKATASYFVLWFPHRQICSFSSRFLFWEVKIKSHGERPGEYGDCCASGISCSAKKCCTSWAECTVALWWICQSPDEHFSGRLRHIASRRRRRACKYIPYLLCDPLERTHDAQHRLERGEEWATLLSCFELGVAFRRRSPLFKTAKPLKKLEYGSLNPLRKPF
jgi:hypothetical protein